MILDPFQDRNFAHIWGMTIMFLFPRVDRPAQEKYVPSLAQKRSARQAANHASPGERPKNRGSQILNVRVYLHLFTYKTL